MNEILKKLSPWCIDQIDFLNDHLRIKGWAFNESDVSCEILCNDNRPTSATFTNPRKDLPIIFPYWVNAHKAGFECRFNLDKLKEYEFAFYRNEEPCDKLKGIFFQKIIIQFPPSKIFKELLVQN